MRTRSEPRNRRGANGDSSQWYPTLHAARARWMMFWLTLASASLLPISTAHANVAAYVPAGSIREPAGLLYVALVLGLAVAIAWLSSLSFGAAIRAGRGLSIWQESAIPSGMQRVRNQTTLRRVAIVCASLALAAVNPMMAIALAMTIVAEVAVAAVAGWRAPESLRSIVLVNLITNPALNAVILISAFTFGLGNTYGSQFGDRLVLGIWVVGEVIVTVAEWRMLVQVTSGRWSSRRLLALSTVSNLVSAGIPVAVGLFTNWGWDMLMWSTFWYLMFVRLVFHIGEWLGRLV